MPFDHEVPASVPDCAVEFFCSGVLFHGVYGLGVFVFQYPLSGKMLQFVCVPIYDPWKLLKKKNIVHHDKSNKAKIKK